MRGTTSVASGNVRVAAAKTEDFGREPPKAVRRYAKYEIAQERAIVGTPAQIQQLDRLLFAA
jgi:hypothetical protein